jgi:TP901 family phage tail tape measure protein
VAGNKIEVLIVGDEASLTRALGKSSAQVEAFGSKLSAQGKKIAGVGKTLTTHLTLPIAAIGAVSAKMAVDFQQSMELVQTQAGASAGEVQRMSKAVLDLAPTVGTGPEELSKALFHIESVGLRGGAALDVLKQAALGAKVGMADLEDTTNALAAANVSGIKGAQNMKTTMATLNAIVGVGNMRMGDLAQSMSSGILPAAKAFGVSLRSVGSALATMTDNGVPAADAATRLRMTFSLLGAPTSKAQTLLKTIGIGATDLATAMRKPGGLINAVQLLHDHLQGLTKVQQAALISGAFGGGRSSSTIITLLGNLDRLKKKYDDIGKGISKYGEAVKKTTETDQFKFEQSLAALQVAGIKLGAALLPSLVSIANAAAKVATAFSNLSPAMRDVIAVTALSVAALGPLLTVFGNLERAGVGLARVFMALTPSLSAAAPAAEAATNGVVGFGAAADGAAASAGGLSLAFLGPAGVVAGGLAAIGIFIHVTHGLGGVTGAMSDATAGAQSYALALQGLKPAQLGVRQAELLRKQSLDLLHAANRKVAQDIKDGLKGSKQYRDDLQAQTQAQINAGGSLVGLRAARQRLIDQQAAITAGQKKEVKGLGELSRDAIAAARAQDGLNNRFGGSILKAGGAAAKLKLLADQANAFSGKTLELAQSQEQAAKKMGGMSTSAGIAQTKTAALSLAASQLTDKLGKVPSVKHILVYYKNNMQTLINQALQLGAAIDHLQSKSLSITTAYRSYHINSGPSGHNAMGTDYWRGGSTWVGERGPEIVDLPRGSVVHTAPESRRIAAATAGGRAGGGGGGDLYVNVSFPNVLVADSKTLDKAARLLAPRLNAYQARSR